MLMLPKVSSRTAAHQEVTLSYQRYKFTCQLVFMWKPEITRLYLTTSNGRKTEVNWICGLLECEPCFVDILKHTPVSVLHNGSAQKIINFAARCRLLSLPWVTARIQRTRRAQSCMEMLWRHVLCRNINKKVLSKEVCPFNLNLRDMFWANTIQCWQICYWYPLQLL